MIQIRLFTQNDLKACETLQREAKFDLSQWRDNGYEFFVVEEQNRINGLCAFKVLKDQQAQIEYIYVRIEDRGFKLGDGLLRATLNHLCHIGATTVFVVSNNETHSFYLKEGLDVHFKDDKTDRMTFMAALPDFFKKPCKSKQ